MKNYVNLHTHGTYSLLDGHGKYERYAERVKELGMPSLGITEHGNVHGLLDFYDNCKAMDVNPVLGCEMYQARGDRFTRTDDERSGAARNEWDQRGPYHLTVLAQNRIGYQNLIGMASKAFTEGYFGKPRMDFDLLSIHSEGLVVLSGCLSGGVQQALLRNDYEAALKFASDMQEIVGKDNYYIEVHDHFLEEERQVVPGLVQIAKTIGAKIIPTCDCHYVDKSDSEAHDLMLCAGTGSRVDDEKRFRFSGPDYYLKSYEEMLELFPAEWLENTLEISDKVDINLSFDEFHFPAPPVDEGKTIDETFDEKVWNGLRYRYGDELPEDVLERANYEIGVIHKMGFSGYFLVLEDVVSWARSQGIRVGLGRGSAAGSICSYALRITGLCPLKFGLLFERFLVEGRNEPPDVDLDIDDRYRDVLIQYVKDKYGHDNVCQIVTFTSVGAKTAIKDAARVLSYDFGVSDKLSRMVPPPVLGVMKTLKESMASPEMAKAYAEDPDAKIILDAACGLEGVLRQTGIHAAGVVIAPGPVSDYIPVSRKGDDKPLVSQYDMVGVDRNKLLKMDFLGLRNLGVVDLAFGMIKERHGIELDLETIDLADDETFKNLRSGNAIGVFQLESAGMRAISIELKPDRIEDIMALVSLYRPGPLGSGMHKTYIGRKNGYIPVEYAHPKMEEILKKSYGIMLYQEDVLNVLKVLAGFSVSEADILRRVMGKKKMKEVAKYREVFVKGCKEHSDIDARLADKIYGEIEYFAGYGFNLSHAGSYGVLAYITAYLKTHFPVEFMTALLSSVADSKDKMVTYLNEARRMGLSIKPPSINRSVNDFAVLSDTEIQYGLGGINGFGEAAVRRIINSRTEDPFYSVADFMRRVDPEILNKKYLENMMYAGALDELVPEVDRTLSRERSMEVLAMERVQLGVYLTEHPLQGLESTLSTQADRTILDLELCADGEFTTIAGIITKVEPKRTKRGDMMYLLNIEDLTSSVDVVVFPSVAKKWADQINEGDIVIMNGRVSKEGDDTEGGEGAVIKFFFFGLEHPELPDILYDESIFLDSASVPDKETVTTILSIIKDHPGNSQVFLEFPEDGKTVTLRFNDTTDQSIKGTLEKMIKVGNVL